MTMTMQEFIQSEANKLNGFVYCSYPFSCSLNEALVYMKNYGWHKHYTIDRTEKITVIKIAPFKGTRKRKALTIKLWIV